MLDLHLCYPLATNPAYMNKIPTLPERYWMVGEKPEFEFTIDKPADRYTLYGNITKLSFISLCTDIF